jgi:hypothetical protein
MRAVTLAVTYPIRANKNIREREREREREMFLPVLTSRWP